MSGLRSSCRSYVMCRLWAGSLPCRRKRKRHCVGLPQRTFCFECDMREAGWPSEHARMMGGGSSASVAQHKLTTAIRDARAYFSDILKVISQRKLCTGPAFRNGSAAVISRLSTRPRFRITLPACTGTSLRVYLMPMHEIDVSLQAHPKAVHDSKLVSTSMIAKRQISV